MTIDENYRSQLDPKIRWLVDEGIAYLTGEDANPSLSRLSQSWQRTMIELQLQLLHRGRRRFPRDQRWLWTERSLAQASDWWSATVKASLFPASCKIVDACCGAGADAIALSRVGQVRAVDSDPTMCAFAQANARLSSQELQLSCLSFSPESARTLADRASFLHIDPDRRPGNRRTTDSDSFTPSLAEILQCSEWFSGAMVKLAPSTRMSPAVEEQVEQASRVWLGNLGECRQQLLLTGELANTAPGLRTAMLAEPNSEPVVFQGQPSGYTECTAAPEQYLYDLHPVLHASDLHTAWGAAHDLRPLGEEHGYFTGSHRLETPWAQCFEVIQHLPWDDRKVRKWLRSADAGVVEIKNRLHPLNAGEFQRRYSGSGDTALTLLVTRLGQRVRAFAAKRA